MRERRKAEGGRRKECGALTRACRIASANSPASISSAFRLPPSAFVFYVLAFAFLGVFLILPVVTAVTAGFTTPDGDFTLGFIREVMANPLYRAGFTNALAIAAVTTALAYAEAAAALTQIQAGPLQRLALTRQWAAAARAQYDEAERLAREGR